jgi:SAM-dependent methyltransferase
MITQAFTQSTLTHLACPSCGVRLSSSDGKVACPSCNELYEVADGVVQLQRDKSAYYCEYPPEVMERILSIPDEHLEEGLFRVFLDTGTSRHVSRYITSWGRAGWMFLLPVSSDSSVLDLGCGWGGLGLDLARWCGSVTSCDSTNHRMRFLAKRARRHGLDNIRLVAGGDTPRLPFLDASFDLVILNGVLEWVPTTIDGDPTAVQLAFLREIRRILRPSGALVLGIENRAAWKTWFMNPDGHCGLRFVPWLPRPLANLYSRAMGKGPYRNYLHTLAGYRKQLAQAGLPQLDAYVPVPGYHFFTRVMSIRDKQALQDAFGRNRRSLPSRLKSALRAWLSSRFPDAFLMVASEAPGERLFAKLVAAYFRDAPGQPPVPVPEIDTYRVNQDLGTVTILDPTNHLVIKFTLHDQGQRDLARAEKLLHELDGAGGLVPQPVPAGPHRDPRVFITRHVAGPPGNEAVADASAWHAALRHYEAQVAQFTNAPADASSQGGTGFLDRYAEALHSLCWTGRQSAVLHHALDLTRSILHAAPRVPLGHGDFKRANVIWRSNQPDQITVVDWGGYTTDELAGYDASFLAISWLADIEQVSPYQCLVTELQNRSISIRNPEIAALGPYLQLPDGPERTAFFLYMFLRRLAPVAEGFETMRFDSKMLADIMNQLESIAAPPGGIE